MMEENLEALDGVGYNADLKEKFRSAYVVARSLVEGWRREISDAKIDLKVFTEKLERLYISDLRGKDFSLSDFSEGEEEFLELLFVEDCGVRHMKIFDRVCRRDYGIEWDTVESHPILKEIGSIVPLGPVSFSFFHRGEARYKAALAKMRDRADQ